MAHLMLPSGLMLETRPGYCRSQENRSPVVAEIMDRVLITGPSRDENSPPATVAVPALKPNEPAPQFVPASVAAVPLIEKHMMTAELFCSMSRFTLLLVNTVCAVPPVVIVPEQSVAR